MHLSLVVISATRPTNHFDSLYLCQVDSSYLGEEFKISDSVWEITYSAEIVLITNNNNNNDNNVASLWESPMARNMGGGSPPLFCLCCPLMGNKFRLCEQTL